MSCYFRGLKDVLDEASIKITPDNKKRIDQDIHDIVGVTYKDCPTTWKKLKQNLTGDEYKRHDFIEKFKKCHRLITPIFLSNSLNIEVKQVGFHQVSHISR